MKNMRKGIAFLGTSGEFIQKVLASLKKDGISVEDLELDHLCYRVETIVRYKEMKKELAKIGGLLSETDIGERPIATYKLFNPILFGKRKIFCVELPSPKKGSPHPEGWEHAEFVIKESFEAFIKKHPKAEFDTSDMIKPINADIRIKYEGFSVKFHLKPLEYVIQHEQKI